MVEKRDQERRRPPFMNSAHDFPSFTEEAITALEGLAQLEAALIEHGEKLEGPGFLSEAVLLEAFKRPGVAKESEWTLDELETEGWVDVVQEGITKYYRLRPEDRDALFEEFGLKK